MKYFYLLLICCIFLATPIFAKEVSKPKHTLSYYAEKFSQQLFPDVKQYLNKNDMVLTDVDAQKIVYDVYSIVATYVLDNTLPILAEPKIKVIKIYNKKTIAFILIVELDLVDSKESHKDLLIPLKIKKVFIIHIHNRITFQQMEI